MDITEVHRGNRDVWNVTAAKYEREVEEDIAYLRAGGKDFLGPQLPFLHELGHWCKRAVHLQCAGGRETLSLWNQGAAEVVGVDISERMIECARRKSMALGASATWFCCDILQTPHALDGTADLVYTGRGALCWMMDINAWAGVAARLLRPAGRLYVFEGHPLDWVWDTHAADFQFDPYDGQYFSDSIHVDREWPTPFIARQDRTAEEHTPVRDRQWTLGAIINSLIEAGLRVQRFEEHPDLFWNQFEHIPAETAARLPHTFSLLMRKE